MSSMSTCPVIGFIDIDAFECQVYQREQPQYRLRPCVVATASGRILSATYEAKAVGVSRNSTPNVKDALKVCPNLHVFRKDNVWGKQDTSKARHATWQLLDCITKFCSKFKDASSSSDVIIELASSDELYLDISGEVTRGIEARNRNNRRPRKNVVTIPANIVWESKRESFIGPFEYRMLRPENWNNFDASFHFKKDEERLAFGALLMNELCKYLQKEIQLSSSAGVAVNKLQAKVGCGLNKPGKITICTGPSVQRISKKISIDSIPGLGGVIGQKLMTTFKISLMSQILKVPFAELETEFGTEKSKQMTSWAAGNDNQPVVAMTMKDKITCNKPLEVISNLNKLSKTLDNLRQEMEIRLKEDEARHRRVSTILYLGFTLVVKGEKSEETVSDSTSFKMGGEEFQLKKLTDEGIKFIKSHSKFQPNGFKITELAIVAKNFRIIDGTDNVAIQFGDLKLSGAPKTLRVFAKPNNSVAQTTCQSLSVVGSFETTEDGKYSSKNVTLRKLLPMDQLTKLRGTDLGRCFQIPVNAVIKDHNAYYELKHTCFIEWLRESKYLEKVESKEFQHPDFISFHGRVADPMQTPLALQFGQWEIYGINVGGVIYLWDQKQPQKSSNTTSNYGLYFEELVSQNVHPSKIILQECQKVYLVNDMLIGQHRLLVVNHVDAEDEVGEPVQVTLFKENFRPDQVSFQQFRELKTWTQCVISGAKRILIGKRDVKGTLKGVEMISTDQLGSQLNGDPKKCLEFTSRFLSWVKLHLPESNEKVVYKFSWVNGQPNVIAAVVPQQEVPKLVVPRLYSSYFKDMLANPLAQAS